MNLQFSRSVSAALLASLIACCLGGCSRQQKISGQVFIVTKGRDNVKLGLVGVHALSDEQLKTAVVTAFEGKAIPANEPLAERLFAILPPPAATTDADGQFALTAKGRVWLLAKAERNAGNSTESYVWVVPTKGEDGKLLLANDKLLKDPDDLRTVLSTLPGVAEVLNKAKVAAEAKMFAAKATAQAKAAQDAKNATEQAVAAQAKAMQDAKDATEKRLEWTGAAMRRAGFTAERITLTLSRGGLVFAWGDNANGQQNSPADLQGMVTGITAGYSHTVALKRDGTVATWGSNFKQQALVPTGLGGVVAIAAGAFHTLALRVDGTVVAWGDNDSGQTKVPPGLTGVTAIAAGQNHSVALKQDGTVVAWGLNDKGQTAVPPGLIGVTAIAAGQNHTVALKCF